MGCCIIDVLRACGRNRTERYQMTAQKDNPYLTITLTDRRPIKIKKDDWPMVADAGDSWHDNQYDFQANRTEKIHIWVRQHADGRAIVYALYDYDTRFQGESGYCARVGMILAADEDIVSGIRSVGDLLQGRCLDRIGNVNSVADVVAACIADLPAEEI